MQVNLNFMKDYRRLSVIIELLIFSII